MPAVTDSPAPGFSLSDFTEMPDRPADDPAAGTTPAVAPVQEPKDASAPVTIPEPEIKPLANEDDAPKDDDEAPQSLENAMRDAPPEVKPAVDKSTKAKEEPAPKDGKETDAAPTAPATTRDDDLKHEMGAHTHPKTRTVITKFQAAAKAARDERDAVIAEREALKKEREELTAKVKSAPAPKELEDEVKTLRERVRELDITKDPLIETKYDKRIASNNDSILEVLKSQGFGKSKVEKDGKVEYVDNPASVSALVKSGLTLKNLQPYIKALEDEGLIEEAEAIRESVRENMRLSRDKTAEIESWKGDHTKRQQAREQQTKQASEERKASFTQQTDSQYRAELEQLEKNFPYLKQPPAPLATDTPAVQKAKQTAIDEYNAAAQKIEAEVKTLNPQAVAPEKVSEVVGKINASAILAIALKTHVLPKVIKDLQTRDMRIKELETELEKIRGAGRMSRLQGASPSGDLNAGKPEPTSLEQAFKQERPS